jgi:hypothetical protein
MKTKTISHSPSSHIVSYKQLDYILQSSFSFPCVRSHGGLFKMVIIDVLSNNIPLFVLGNFFSSPKLTAQVNYSDRRLSIVHPSIRLSVNFYIFDFFSRTTEPILSRLGTHHPFGGGVLKFVQMKGITFLQGKIIAKRVKIH